MGGEDPCAPLHAAGCWLLHQSCPGPTIPVNVPVNVPVRPHISHSTNFRLTRHPAALAARGQWVNLFPLCSKSLSSDSDLGWLKCQFHHLVARSPLENHLTLSIRFLT